MIQNSKWAWWHTVVILGFRKLRWKDSEFKASWGYVVGPSVKKPKQVNKHTTYKQNRFIILLWLENV